MRPRTAASAARSLRALRFPHTNTTTYTHIRTHATRHAPAAAASSVPNGRARMSTVVEDAGAARATPPPPPPQPAATTTTTTGASAENAAEDYDAAVARASDIAAAREAGARDVFRRAVAATEPRTNWTREEIAAVYYTPLMELAFQAGSLHRRFHAPNEVQLCTLMNIKTGGCSEDCSYCAQSTRHQTGLQATRVESVESVLAAAKTARDNGSTRFCMGAAWRDMRGRKTSLRNIKAMVSGVRDLGMESCVTLGMIDAAQAKELADAGLTAYNHNLDTSREFYPSVISTRTYDERLATLGHVRDAGINVCSGGILGLGEKSRDHVGLLHTVSTLPAHPESFPVNRLVPIPGTPLGERKPVAFPTLLRMIATARIVLPSTIIRIAAGRTTMSEEQQAMCFMAGANAVFTGEKMLTTECNGWEQDSQMFARWGLEPMKSFEKTPAEATAPEAEKVATEAARAEAL